MKKLTEEVKTEIKNNFLLILQMEKFDIYHNEHQEIIVFKELLEYKYMVFQKLPRYGHRIFKSIDEAKEG